MNTAPSQLNLKKLRALVAEKPRYKAIFELILVRERGRPRSQASVLKRRLRESGKGEYTLVEIREFFTDMQGVGAGSWVAGRKKKEGFFLWGFHMVAVAEAALNKRAKNFVARDKDNKPLPKGTLIPPPKAHNSLPWIDLDDETETSAAPAPERNRRATDVGYGASSGSPRTYRMNLTNGEYIDVPFGLSPEERQELMEWVKVARLQH